MTLYIGSLGRRPRASRLRRDRLPLLRDGPVPSFYWVDHGFGYALAGALPRDALLELATVVYRQLEKTGGIDCSGLHSIF